MRYYIFLLSFLLISGCATSQKINKVQLGMTKDEVIKIMGPPVSISAQKGVEYLNYSLSETSDQAFKGITIPYYVRIVNGRVESFGRAGDFDSTKPQTIRIETDENIKVKTKTSEDNHSDISTKLKKLKQLFDEGLITEKEYESKKKELLKNF